LRADLHCRSRSLRFDATADLALHIRHHEHCIRPAIVFPVSSSGGYLNEAAAKHGKCAADDYDGEVVGSMVQLSIRHLTVNRTNTQQTSEP
jgi:hypothetical protein